MRRLGIALLSAAIALAACGSDDNASGSGGGMGGTTGGAAGAGGTSGSSGTASGAGGSAGVTSGGTSSGAGIGGSTAGSGGTQAGSAGAMAGAGCGNTSAGTTPMGQVLSCLGEACPYGECSDLGVSGGTPCATAYPGPVDGSSMFCPPAGDGGHCLRVGPITCAQFWSVNCASGTASFELCAGDSDQCTTSASFPSRCQ